VSVYVYADALALTPMLLLEYESIDADPATGRRFFLFANQIGAPVLVEDDHAKAIWSASLDPYGTAHVRPSDTVSIPLRFPATTRTLSQRCSTIGSGTTVRSWDATCNPTRSGSAAASTCMLTQPIR